MSFFFPGMGGMGGFPGMGGGEDDGDQGGQEEVDNEKYYKILGVDKKASDAEIKKQYKKLARELHPDKHPEDPETYQKKFVEMQAAYEVLGDSDKRQLYDKYGEAGVKGGGGGGSGMGDIFDMFFGGHGGGGGRGRGGGKQQTKKAPVIRIPLDVTLEDIYMGSTKKLSFKRYRQCKDCGGKGGKKVIECNECNGRGVQVVMQRMGFVTMQSQRQCSKCDGEGTIIREEDKCKKCQGKGLNEEKVEQNFDIPIGSKHAEQVTLRGQGHEVPNAANGDIVVILRVEKHPVFQRIGADLAMNYELTLKEALCGYNVKIKHFGNRVVHLRSKLGEITQPSQLKVVYGLGMPQKNSGHVKGHLYIKFEVKLPENGALTNDNLQQIGKLLPNSPSDLTDQQDEKERVEKAKKDEERKKNRDAKKKNKKKNNKKSNNNNNNNNNNKAKNNDKDDDGDIDVDNDDEDHDDDMQTIDIDAEAHPVDGEPKATPYSAKSAYDEDEEEQEGVKCQHM